MNIDPLSSVPPPPPAEVAATETDLAPGFRFHPTDEELVSYYLKRRVLSKPFAVDAIAEVDLYKADPWDLPAQSRIKSRDMEWYFFSPLDKKYSNRSRTNRATGKGYWKTTGKDRPVKRGYRLIGMKKTLVFHVGKAPKGIRTNWVMHEYRLEDEELVRAGVPQDEYVVCRIFEKHGPGPQNGAQYGAPLADQDWEYDADNRPEDRQTPNLDIAQKENIQSGALILVSEDDHSTADASVTATEFNEKLSQDQSAAIDVDENSTPGVNYDVASANLGECGSFPEPQQDCCSPKDDFLEMKDLADPIGLESPGFQDDNLYFNGIRNDLVASNPFSDNDTLTEFDGVDEVFHAGVGSVESAESVSDLSIKDSYYHENVDLTNPVASKYLCSEQVADDMLCYDAANYTSTVEYDAFVEANDFLEPLDLEQSSIDPMDEMIAYLDATEGSLGNLDYGNFSGIGESHITSKVHANVQAPPTDTSDGNVPEGSPSRKALPHCQKEAKDDGYNFGLDKTFKGRLIGMLDSISSPPAFAAEPKDLKLTATSHPSSSSIHITAGMICINGLAINGNKKLWSDQKNDVSFLLSYSSMSASIHGDSGNLPNGKMQGGVISLAVRSGICLSFLSILFLATIFKVGSYVYSR